MKPPQIKLSDSSLTILKIIAVLLMLADHINKYLYSDKYSVIFYAGRVAMPLFVFVLAYNMARPIAIQNPAIFTRVIVRLIVVAMVSSVPFIALGFVERGWFPLNILFMLSVSLICCRLWLEQHQIANIGFVFVWVVGSLFVEFWWPATAMFIACWLYCRQPAITSLVVALACLIFGLYAVNGNYWAVMALPIIYGVSQVQIELPRIKWFFYAFYPVHLATLWLFIQLTGWQR